MAGWGWILYLQKYIWVQKRRRPLCGTSTKLVQNGQPALLTMTFMWLQIGIRQPVPPEISLSWKKKQRYVTILQKHKKGLFALLRLKHQRRGKYNLMAAAKKLSNDLMPFSFKNSGNDVMSFCSKEWVDRLGWIGSAQIPVKSLSWKMQLHILLLLSPENNRTLLYVKYEELKMMIYSLIHISNMEIIFDWYGDDICLILRWYLSDMEMIFVWYGDDICLRRRPSESSATADV